MVVVAVVVRHSMYYYVSCVCFPGSEHESVHRGTGPADPERFAVCGENGSSVKGSGKQIQTSGRRT